MPQNPATNTRGKSKVSTKWLNNVMKSIGAASVDNFKEIAPNLSELGKGTAGAIRSIKDVTTGNNVSQVSKALSNNSTIKSVKKAFTNSLNDIKTGKIYNNERLTETMEESFGDFDFSDFEDCLQMECARDYGAKYIVTRNIADYEKSEIKAISPSDFLKGELMH